MFRLVRLAGAGLTMAMTLCGSANGRDSTNSTPLAVWDTLIRASVGGGYRDNILRTSVAPESSAFFYSGGELSFLRLSETGSQLSVFLFGEDWRYPDVPSVGSEQLASATAQGSWLVGSESEAGAEIQYLYQNQVADLSENDAELRRLLIEGHSLWLRPKWKCNFQKNWTLQAEALGARQLYTNDELDNYWETAGRLSLLYQYGHRSELSMGVQTAQRLYDSREEYDASGLALTNTSLVYWRPEAGSQWRHFWDAKRHWRSTIKASYLWNDDGGSQYFNYDRVLFSTQLRWADSRWEIKANARLGWYLYSVQEIESEPRRRSYYVLDLRVERRFGKHLFAFAAGEREWNLSNDPLDEYQDWAASGGIGAEF